MKLWIARDKGTDILWVFDKPPVLRDKNVESEPSWFVMTENDVYSVLLSHYLFPEVTFENSPQEIEVKLVNDKVNDFAEDLITTCKPLEGEFSKFIDDNFDDMF